MTDRELVIGGTYRHWKTGRLYEVLAEWVAEHAYSSGSVFFFEKHGDVVVAGHIKKNEIGVIYKDKDNRQFVREKSSFLEKVEGRNRFELVE